MSYKIKNISDLRYNKIETAINNEFIKLLKEKSFNEISVSEICKKANCSRNAFYSHYEDKECLYDNIIKEIIERIKINSLISIESVSNECIEEKFFMNLYLSVRKEKDLILIFSKENKDNLKKIFTKAIYDCFMKIAELIYSDKKSFLYQFYCHFYSSGFVELIIQAFKKKLSKEETIKILHNIAWNISKLSSIDTYKTLPLQ